MLTISCGAALHHVRVPSRPAAGPPPSTGCRTTPTRPARPTDRRPAGRRSRPQPCACCRRCGSATPTAGRSPTRRSTRTSWSGRATAAEAEGSGLHLLRPDDVIELASAAAHAQDVEGLDEAGGTSWRTGSAGPPTGLGLPDAVIPAEPPPPPCPAATSATAAPCRSATGMTAPRYRDPLRTATTPARLAAGRRGTQRGLAHRHRTRPGRRCH